MAYLAGLLRKLGCAAHLCSPAHLRWHDSIAHLESSWHRGPLGAVVRFHQVEWMASHARCKHWPHFFTDSRTPIANAGVSILTESKRFPLVWPQLKTELPTWRELLPETRDPRHAPWKTDDAWLLKSAYCNAGESVTIRALQNSRQWRAACRSVFWQRRHWIAQKRFETLPLQTPLGRLYPCIGVYTIDGKAAGIYARASAKPFIDCSAIDVAVLLAPDLAAEIFE
jgi:glutathionylspermidine synthase